MTETVEVPLAQPCEDEHRGACRGPLAPGFFHAVLFRPHFGYVVPSGWDNFDDDSDTFGLQPIGGDMTAGIFVFKNVRAAAQNERCSQRPEPGVGTSPRELARWFLNHPGLKASPWQATAVGNLPGGLVLDLTMDDSWERRCPFSEGQPIVSLITAGAEPNPANHVHWTIGGPTYMRVWLVSLPDGQTAMIEVEARSMAEFMELLREAEPIIDSFVFAT